MDAIVSGRIAASLVAYAVERRGRADTDARLGEHGLDAWSDAAPRTWLHNRTLTRIARALAEDESSESLAREAGRIALRMEPLGGLAHLVEFLADPAIAFHQVPLLLPLFVRGAVVTVEDSVPGATVVRVGLGRLGTTPDTLAAFGAGLMESLPTFWSLPLASSSISFEPGRTEGPDTLTIVFQISWQGADVASPAVPLAPTQELGRLDAVATLLQEGLATTLFEVSPTGELTALEGDSAAAIGLTPGTLGQPLAAIAECWRQPPLAAAVARAHQGNAAVATVTSPGEGHSTTRVFRVRLHPLRTGAETEATAFIGNVVDWSDEQQRRADLAQRSRLANLGRWSAATAHEFNNALTGILGYANLGRTANDPAVKSRAFAFIEESASHAQSVVETLLQYARPTTEAPRVGPVDLAAVLLDAAQLVQVSSDRTGVRLSVRQGSVPPALGTRDGYHQIVVNLLQNAVDAAASGRRKPAPPTVEVTAELVGSSVEVKVTDNGPGIPTDVMERIFEPFFSTKGQGEVTFGGTGLGLPVSQALAVELGAKIRIDSSDPSGTAMVLCCPLALASQSLPDPALSATASHVEVSASGRRLEVLVADDEPVVRTLLMDIIEHEGHEAVGAFDGADALRLLMEHHFDVVFCDVLMPVMSGLELLDRLEGISPRPEIVMMTGKLTRDVESEILRHPISTLLTKPFPMARVSELLAGFSR